MKKSAIVKRSTMIHGHKTSVSLEDQFWNAVRDIAAARGMAVRAVIEEVDANRTRVNLSSALRVFVLEHYRERAKRADPLIAVAS